MNFRILALAMFVTAAGCGDLKPERPGSDAVGVGEEAGPGHHPQPVLDLSKRTVLSDKERAVVIATVGKTEITLGDYESRLNDQPAYVRVRYNSLDKKKEFLDNLVRFELLAFEARERGFDSDPDVVFSMKEAMIKKLMTEDVETLVSMTDITDGEIETYYAENQHLFKKPEQVRVNQVVVADEASAKTIHAAVAKAFEESPRKKKQVFMENVREHSIDEATKSLNGDTGFFGREGKLDDKRGRLSAKVTEAAFSLQKINELSAVIHDGNTYRILMLANRRPPIEKTLDEVRRQIRNKLFRTRKDQAREGYLKGLKEKIGVTVYPDVLSKVQDPQPTTNTGPSRPDMKDVPGVEAVKKMRKHLDENAAPTAVKPPKESANEQK